MALHCGLVVQCFSFLGFVGYEGTSYRLDCCVIELKCFGCKLAGQVGGTYVMVSNGLARRFSNGGHLLYSYCSIAA